MNNVQYKISKPHEQWMFFEIALSSRYWLFKFGIIYYRLILCAILA